MAQSSIDRIRSATFSIARRGYDKREVERFLTQIADWLERGGDDPARVDIVRRELERVGDRTKGILSAAEETAEELRAEAERETAETLRRARNEAQRMRADAEQYALAKRQETDRYSEQTRSAADKYATEQRQAADLYAEETREAVEEEARRGRMQASMEADEIVRSAEAKAEGIVDEGIRRRRDLETLISDIEQRRDEVLDQIAALNEDLAEIVAPYFRTEEPETASEEAGTASEEPETASIETGAAELEGEEAGADEGTERAPVPASERD